MGKEGGMEGGREGGRREGGREVIYNEMEYITSPLIIEFSHTGI